MVHSINDKIKNKISTIYFTLSYDFGISSFSGALEVRLYSLCSSDVLTMVNYLRCLSNSLLDHGLSELNGRVKITNLSRVLSVILLSQSLVE